jgi:ribosome-binding ATPase
MKIGLIGLPQTGKKTLFGLITKHRLTENEIASNKPVSGIAEIIDPRFERLVEIYKPASEARARLNVEFIPKLEKGSFTKEEVLKALDGADVLCHVVRDFKDESVYHINGSVDAKRDIDEINSELIFNDLAFIDKRLNRLNQTLKRSSEEKMLRERDALVKVKTQLEKELPLRLLDFTPEELKQLVSYPLFTLKEMIVVLNVSEQDLKDTSKLEAFKKEYAKLKIFWIQVSVKVEAEIAAFESEEDRKTFLKELGIAEPAVDLLKRTCIESLNLSRSSAWALTR